MHNIAVARVTPVGEVSKGEADVMVRVIHSMAHHVRLHVATAADSAALRLQTHPILTDVVAVDAWGLHCHICELLFGGDVLGGAVRAVRLWAYGVEALHILKSTLAGHNFG